MNRIGLFFVLVLGLLAQPGLAETPPIRAAFLGLHFLNSTQDPNVEAETARTERMEARLVERLSESGQFVFIDPETVAETLGDRINLYENIALCNNCDARFAEELGAEAAVTGVIQKTSNLILHITIFVREAETGELLRGGSADIRGNTEESWSRGIDYIVRNRLLKR